MTKAELMQLVALGLVRESFSHLNEGREDVYIVSDMRRRMIEEKREPVMFCFPEEDTKQFLSDIRRDRDIEQARVEDESLDINDPGIIVEFPATATQGPQHLIVDGTHRILRRLEVLGMRNFPMWVIPRHEAIMADASKGDLVLNDAWGTPDFIEKKAAEYGQGISDKG